jgi:hypothetical protein
MAGNIIRDGRLFEPGQVKGLERLGNARLAICSLLVLVENDHCVTAGDRVS